MLAFSVRIDWVLLALVGALAVVLAWLYAALLSTRMGKEVCEWRTYCTVIGGHLLMALTMCFVSPPVAGLWLVWSALSGSPLVVLSLVQEWRREEARDEARDEARWAAIFDSCSGNGYEPSGRG